MKKPGALKGLIALRQMPEKMRELFRVHFEDWKKVDHHHYEPAFYQVGGGT